MATRYYDMKQCFDACGDEDIPFVEGLYNDERGLTKKIATRHHHYPSFEAAWSDQWQIQRMCLCQGCKEYFKSEDCESISGSGTFNCDECNHPEQPVPQTASEYIKNCDQREGFAFEEIYSEEITKAFNGGKLAEYQRPEQVELREAVEKWVKMNPTLSATDRGEYAIICSYANLKPPT